MGVFAFGVQQLAGTGCSCSDLGVSLGQGQSALIGMATVIELQLHCTSRGCGHALSGRPGFLTNSITLSLACVHLVDRCPRMHGPLKMYKQKIIGIVGAMAEV